MASSLTPEAQCDINEAAAKVRTAPTFGLQGLAHEAEKGGQAAPGARAWPLAKDSFIDSLLAGAMTSLTPVAQCAINEAAAKKRTVPMFGLQGPAHETEKGGQATPGPLVWPLAKDSFIESLENGGKDRLLDAWQSLSTPPGSGGTVVYMRVNGSHGAGKRGGPLPTEEPSLANLRVEFKCSQSAAATKAKWGHEGERPEPRPAGQQAGVGPPSKRRAVAFLGRSSCKSRFVVAMRCAMSRPSKCSYCGAAVRCSTTALDDPCSRPTMQIDGKIDSDTCPWRGHTDKEGCHVVQSGHRIVLAANCHTEHWHRPVRLSHRVTSATAAEMAALQSSTGAPTAVLAAMHAKQTGGLLSSKDANRALRQVRAAGGKDVGLPGLLESLRQRGDVVILIRWRVVRSAYVCTDYSVAADGALRIVCELHCPPVHPGATATRWDVTSLFEAESSGSWSAVVNLFRLGTTPEQHHGVKPLSEYVLGEGYVLNAGAVYWQTRQQTEEALRSPQLVITDTSPKTNSTTMEYGVYMIKNSMGESCQAAHYVVNGLTLANYEFAHAARRFLMGPVARRTELRLTDGDPQLVTVSERDGKGSRNHALCRFHAINLTLRALVSANGFDMAERDEAADLKDRIFAAFRGCETEGELLKMHAIILDSIKRRSLPPGPTRVRRKRAREGQGDSTNARSSNRRSKVKHEVKEFVARVGDLVTVKWTKFEDTTDEPIAALLKDLGPPVFAAYCRAAGIVANHGVDSNMSSGLASTAHDADQDCVDIATVQRFIGSDANGNVVVKWVGSAQTTVESTKALLHDLGRAQFAAFCNAAGITETALNHDFTSTRDASITISSILTTWCVEQIWSKRWKLAWCYRRGSMTLGNDTTGAAEGNFQVLKRGGVNGINDKTSMQALAERVHHQEIKRLANITAARISQFSMVPASAVGVPDRLLSTWTRLGLQLVSKEAECAGLRANDADPEAVAKHYVWEVEPQPGSHASKAWVVLRAGMTAAGEPHRIRVVHLIHGRMVCTCCTHEIYDIECRHCLSIHGSVADTSASLFWRQGTAMGVNDDLLLAAYATERPVGSVGRATRVHCAAGRPNDPPSWAVHFGDRHAELKGGGIAAAPAPQPLSARARGHTAVPTGGGTRGPDSNYHIGQRMGAIFARLQAMAASSGTGPTDAAALLDMAELMEKAAVERLTGRATVGRGNHHDAGVETTMRHPHAGSGSSKRAKGQYEAR